MTATDRAPELKAAIDELPRFLRSPIFMPTDRVPVEEAIAGLARVKSLYDGELDAVYRPRLRALKAARRNRRCFVIGNGPSLGRTDLTRLQGEVTFATNGFFLKMPELSWSPTYYVVEDHLVGEDRAEQLSTLRGSNKLYPASLAYALHADDDTTYFDHRPRVSYPDGFDFSFDADQNTFTGGTVTYTCMQLAAYLGFQEIYLIGVDADYAIPADAALSGRGRIKEIDMPSDDPNHFHPDYFGKGKRWHEPNVDTMLAAYEEARRATEARGVSIVNATVGGKLEVFPRIDYEMLFRPKPAEKLLVIDHTRMGNGTATGEVKAAVLGNWPPDRLMQLHSNGKRRLRIEGGPATDPATVDVERALTDRISDFDPDLILYRPVPDTELLHAFAMELIDRTKLPLAVWIADDWPSAYAVKDPEHAARLDTDFRWLLGRADTRLSISGAMSQAFHARYGRPFVPIANGIDPADWAPARLRPAEPVKVRYAGSLAEDMTLHSVELVARVVERLAAAGVPISMEIKTHAHWHAKFGDRLTGLQHTTIEATDMPIDEYRRWLSEADILVIASNFDDRSREYIRYSLANKLPECLASGAAVFAVGPDDVGTIAAMASLDVGERVTVADESVVADALRRLAESPERRLELAERAQAIAFSLFDVHQTQRAFESAVGRVAAAHRAGDYPRDIHAHVDETAIVAGLLHERQGDSHVMLDVGAHLGSSAIPFARLGWTVHCFEPHPVMRAELTERFAQRPNVHVDPHALGDAIATGVQLFESPESSGIAGLTAFHVSHEPVATVDVTTITEIVRERDLSKVDFLKVDVEGHDLAVLRGVPWAQLQPDVVECEFEDAKTLALGHTWRDIAAYLRLQGYTVYVSEWHPIIRYGKRHDWRRVVPFDDELDLDPAGWGNLVAFREDPGWDAIRRAFDMRIERGRSAAAKAPLATPAKAPIAEVHPVHPARPVRPGRPGLLRRLVRRARRVARRVAGLPPPQKAGAAMARPAQAASDATSDATSGTVAGAASGAASGTAADNASGAASGAAAKKAAPAARVHGHDLLTRLLPDIAGHVARGTVVEIGSTREKLEGQGSTVILATLAAQLGLPFVTVDMDPANTEQARTDLARLGGARAVTDRGENFLAKFEGPIVAAYLDAFDIQHGHHSDYRVERYRQFLGTEITNTASSAMHLACAEALLPRLVPGGLIVIDDTWLDAGAWTGKGSTAVPALLAAGFYIVGRAKTAIALRSGLGA